MRCVHRCLLWLPISIDNVCQQIALVFTIRARIHRLMYQFCIRLYDISLFGYTLEFDGWRPLFSRAIHQQLAVAQIHLRSFEIVCTHSRVQSPLVEQSPTIAKQQAANDQLAILYSARY